MHKSLEYIVSLCVGSGKESSFDSLFIGIHLVHRLLFSLPFKLAIVHNHTPYILAHSFYYLCDTCMMYEHISYELNFDVQQFQHH